jgi:hypothetical protein
VLNGDRSRAIVRLTAGAGGTVRLSARGSSDPDGDRIAYRWFHYPEPGGAERALDLGPAASESLSFAAPKVDAPADLHIVLEVKDSGKPALFAYRRAIVRVTPAAD